MEDTGWLPPCKLCSSLQHAKQCIPVYECGLLQQIGEEGIISSFSFTAIWKGATLLKNCHQSIVFDETPLQVRQSSSFFLPQIILKRPLTGIRHGHRQSARMLKWSLQKMCKVLAICKRSLRKSFCMFHLDITRDYGLQRGLQIRKRNA